MALDGKVFYGINGGVLAVSFVASSLALEFAKPDFVLDKAASTDKKKVVNHYKAIGYSAAIAIAATAVSVAITNMFAKDKINAAVHTTTVIVGTMSLVYVILAIVQPNYLIPEGKKEIDHTKAGLIALVAGIIAGTVDYMVYSRVARPDFSVPSASCFPEMSFGKSHYKMSFPGSCSAASE